jgi:hypothetical protein
VPRSRQTPDDVERKRQLQELTQNLEELRIICQTKRERLWGRAARRNKWQKGLHIAGGVIALFSGGAITSVVTSLTSSLTMKIIAAALAFLSGGISLVTTTLFDSKESVKMFDGAARYAALRDKAQTLYERRTGIAIDRVTEQLGRLRAESSSLAKEFDHLLPDLQPPRLPVGRHFPMLMMWARD